MLIPLQELQARHNLRVTGVLHVGAHLGEEAKAYNAAGFTPVTWIEGNPDLIQHLKANVHRYGHQVICALVSDEDGPREFKITNNGESSSLLDLGTHLETSPQVEVVKTYFLGAYRLEELVESYAIRFNFLNLDLQGAELLALRGLGERISDVDYIYTEVNKREVYIGCAQVEDLDEYLGDFDRVETLWCEDGGVNHGWGDAFYVRRNR